MFPVGRIISLCDCSQITEEIVHSQDVEIICLHFNHLVKDVGIVGGLIRREVYKIRRDEPVSTRVEDLHFEVMAGAVRVAGEVVLDTMSHDDAASAVDMDSNLSQHSCPFPDGRPATKAVAAGGRDGQTSVCQVGRYLACEGGDLTAVYRVVG